MNKNVFIPDEIEEQIDQIIEAVTDACDCDNITAAKAVIESLQCFIAGD